MTEKLRVLIAEDEALVAMGLEALLMSLGHDVVGKAKNGAECVEMADRTRPDLIITDIKMPGMDGITAASAILTEQRVPVIVLTAFSDEDLIKSANEIGVAAYLTKPVTEANLKPAITLAVSRFQELQLLRDELGSLKDALESRKLVERAKGIIMDKHKLSEADAFRFLQKQSSKRNIKMAELARLIIEASDIL